MNSIYGNFHFFSCTYFVCQFYIEIRLDGDLLTFILSCFCWLKMSFEIGVGETWRFQNVSVFFFLNSCDYIIIIWNFKLT